jgi:hypothetical protein
MCNNATPKEEIFSEVSVTSPILYCFHENQVNANRLGLSLSFVYRADRLKYW